MCIDVDVLMTHWLTQLWEGLVGKLSARDRSDDYVGSEGGQLASGLCRGE